MKRKNILLIVVCIVMGFFLTGCGKKTVITTEQFKNIGNTHNFVISDVTVQYSSYNYINEATVIQNPDGWQMEFYVLSNEEYADSMFNTNKNTFENQKENSSLESSVSMGNYSTYSLTSGGYYMHLCRVDNTLLYVRVEEKFKDSVNKIIDELGY